MIVGMVSSYREGALAPLAIRGLAECCDTVLVLEGPVGSPHEHGEPSQWRPPGGRKPATKDEHVIVRQGGPWASDAAKRTELLGWAKKWSLRGGVDAGHWGIVVDGDEELLYGYALPAYLARAVADDPRGTLTLKVCEADGQVHESGARCLPLAFVDRYLLSSHVLGLAGSDASVTLPLRPAAKAPIMGEPHILHRSYLRPPDRGAPEQRLSSHELRDLERLGIVL